MDLCSLCESLIPEGERNAWFTQDGERIDIAKRARPAALAETTLGDIYICEECYEKGLPSYFTPQDFAEIHYQFGLEYYALGQYLRSIESFTQSRQVEESAEVLAALALAESDMGHIEIARTLYMKALQIEPNHFISIENLKNLESKK